MKRPKLELTEADGQAALQDHLREKAAEARARYGPQLEASGMRELLADPTVVRFKTRLAFDAGPLRPGEFGWARPLGETPHSGFELVLHPELEGSPDWPLCAAYHLVSINYLDVATSAEAEVFGAALFGLDVDTFYARLCSIADSLPNAIGTDGHRMPGELPLEDANACAGAGPEPVAATAVEAFLAPHLAAASVPAASGAPGTPGKEPCGASCSCSSPALDGGSL